MILPASRAESRKIRIRESRFPRHLWWGIIKTLVPEQSIRNKGIATNRTMNPQEQTQSILPFRYRRLFFLCGTARQREIVVMRARDGFTAVEIAHRIGRTPKQANKIIHRVKNSVQFFFQERNSFVHYRESCLP